MPIHSAVIQKLLSTNAHLGRRITSHHITPYLHGFRNSISIIDSDKTLISLRNALDFMSHLIRTRSSAAAATPPRFLFVNTCPLYDDIFDHMTRLTGHRPFLSPQAQYWRLGGFMTNPSSPRIFRSRNKKICFPPVAPPDCVFVVDPESKSSVINEAHRVGVPVVALVDSDTPKDVYDKITYPIVAGDSVQFVYLLCNLITKTFLLEQRDLRKPEDGGDDQIASSSASAGKQAELKDTAQTTEEMKAQITEEMKGLTAEEMKAQFTEEMKGLTSEEKKDVPSLA